MSRLAVMLVMWCSTIGLYLLGVQKFFDHSSYKEIILYALILFISAKILAYVLRLLEWYLQGDKSIRISVIKELKRVEFPKSELADNKRFSDSLYDVSMSSEFDVEVRVYASMLAETLRLGNSLLDRRIFNSFEWSLNKAYEEYSSSSN